MFASFLITSWTLPNTTNPPTQFHPLMILRQVIAALHRPPALLRLIRRHGPDSLPLINVAYFQSTLVFRHPLCDVLTRERSRLCLLVLPLVGRISPTCPPSACIDRWPDRRNDSKIQNRNISLALSGNASTTVLAPSIESFSNLPTDGMSSAASALSISSTMTQNTGGAIAAQRPAETRNC